MVDLLICFFLKYEDEYDDTYDSQAVGSEEPDAHNEDELRPFVVPRVLQKNEDYDVDEEGDGEEIPQKSADRPRDQFVANPAELRELAEQRRLNRRGYRRPGPTPAQRDVVGKSHFFFFYYVITFSSNSLK